MIEGALLELDAEGLARARTASLERLLAESTSDVVSTLGGLAEPGEALVIEPDAGVQQRAAASPAPALDRLELTCALHGAHALTLDMRLELSVAGIRHGFSKTQRLSDAQLFVWDTELETGAGEHAVLLIQPTLIDSVEELQELLALERQNAPARR